MDEPKRVGALVSVDKDWKMGARGVALLGVDGRWIVYHDGGTGYDRRWSDLRDPQPLTPEQLAALAGGEPPATAHLTPATLAAACDRDAVGLVPTLAGSLYAARNGGAELALASSERYGAACEEAGDMLDVLRTYFQALADAGLDSLALVSVTGAVIRSERVDAGRPYLSECDVDEDEDACECPCHDDAAKRAPGVYLTVWADAMPDVVTLMSGAPVALAIRPAEREGER